MISKEILELRKDPKNYIWKGLIYHSPKDPYIIAPKRRAWMGWMFNFAHPKVWPMLFYALFASITPILFFIYLRHKNDWPLAVLYIGIASHVILLFLWAYKESTEAH